MATTIRPSSVHFAFPSRLAAPGSWTLTGPWGSLVVDTLGLLLAVSVGAANLQDREAGLPAVARAAEKYPEVASLFVDSAYAGGCAQRIAHDHGIRVEVVRHPGNRTVGRWIDAVEPDLFEIRANADGFVPLPKRWVVERTHAWNERARRLIMYHDVWTDVSETWVWHTEARILLRRLTNEVTEAWFFLHPLSVAIGTIIGRMVQPGIRAAWPLPT